MTPQQNLELLQNLLKAVPGWVYQSLAFMILSNFAAIGSLINKIVEYRILTNDVHKLKTDFETLHLDFNAAHDKIRDLEAQLVKK